MLAVAATFGKVYICEKDDILNSGKAKQCSLMPFYSQWYLKTNKFIGSEKGDEKEGLED